jgi:glycoprotein 3-alpha-L-fucosyltransferase
VCCSNDVVPVVMGARPEDYAAVAPPHSYIHVDDFESPRQLAAYLLKLHHDDALYNAYFAWKGSGQFINTKFWCRLCTAVHAARLLPQPLPAINKPDDWWRGADTCIMPQHGKRWSSWRREDNRPAVNDVHPVAV